MKSNSIFLFGSIAAAALTAIPAAVQAGEIFAISQTGRVVGGYDTTTGAGNPSLISNGPGGHQIAASGGDLFIATYEPAGGSIAEYDATTGALINNSLVGGLYYAYGVAVSGGNLFVESDSSLNLGYTGTIGEYNAATGATINASLVTGLPLYQLGNGIAVCGGDLFVISQVVYDINQGGAAVSEYDANTGALINPDLITIANNGANAIAISGGDLFLTNLAGWVGEYTTSGATVNAALITGLNSPSSIGVLGNDIFVAQSNGTIGEYTTSGATVNSALVTGPYVSGIAVVSTPEPSTWVMFAIGAAALLSFSLYGRPSHV